MKIQDFIKNCFKTTKKHDEADKEKPEINIKLLNIKYSNNKNFINSLLKKIKLPKNNPIILTINGRNIPSFYKGYSILFTKDNVFLICNPVQVKYILSGRISTDQFNQFIPFLCGAASIDYNNSSLSITITNNLSIEIAKALYPFYPNIFNTTYINDFGSTPIMFALWNNNIDFYNKMIDLYDDANRYNINLNAQDYEGKTLLMSAIMKGYDDIAKELINRLNLDQLAVVDKKGRNALDYAILFNNQNIKQKINDCNFFTTMNRNISEDDLNLLKYIYNHEKMFDSISQEYFLIIQTQIDKFSSELYIKNQENNNWLQKEINRRLNQDNIISRI